MKSNMHRSIVLAALGLAIASTSAGAGERIERLRDVLSQRLPGITIESVAASPIPGVFEVTYDGGVLYVSEDGRFGLSGTLINLETRENLTERTRARQRLAALGDVPESRMIVFEPAGETKHTITTFTDIDCPYCRKMHREMAQMNASGIRVRYMLFPRAGPASVSYDKAVSVWCAPDQRGAMTRAKAGETPERRTCENPVDEHMALARRLGLTGTPFTITETGRAIAGYMPAPALLDSLEADMQAKAP